MANFNSLSGFSPVQYLNGAQWSGGARLYYVPSTDTNTYAPGDPVATTPGADTNGVPQITIGVAGQPVRGVVISCGVSPRDLSRVVVPSAKLFNYYFEVVDDPQVIFEIQEGGSSAPLSSTSVGLQANFAVGALATGVSVSQSYLDNATVTPSSTLNLNLLGLAQKQGNAFGQYAKWLVLLQNHELI